MLTLVSITGFVIAIIIFLNIINAREKIRQPVSQPDIRYDVKKVYSQTNAHIEKPRICPVCGTSLSRKEYLIAALEPEVNGKKRRAHIYGCPHCFTTEGVNINARFNKLEP